MPMLDTIEEYYKIRSELDTERHTLTRQLVKIAAIYEEALSDLCRELVEHLKLFELFPYFPKLLREKFIKDHNLYYRIPNTDGIYIYMSIEETGLYIELSGNEHVLEEIFYEYLRKLPNSIEKLKEAADLVKTYIK